MADILDAAQSNTQPPSGTTPPVPPVVEPVPEVPMEPAPVPPMPPVISFEPATTSEPIAPSSDSLIVPPPETPAPEPTISSAPPVPPPTEKPKKKSRIGVLLAGLLLLVITLPILVFYVRQQIEIRSRAANTTGPYPPWSTCSNIGDTTTDLKGNCLECKTNTSGGPNPAWAPCGGTPNCPWTPSAATNNMCCPTGTDACSTPGDTKCIPDPFISICSVWDTNCPAGHKNYWVFQTNVTSCDNITPTLIPETPTWTPSTPTPPTPPTPQCINIVAYKNGNALSASDLSALQPGNTITLAFAPGGAATKARFKVTSSGDAGRGVTPTWNETTTKNANGQFIWDYSLSAGVVESTTESFSIAAQWFDGSAWH